MTSKNSVLSSSYFHNQEAGYTFVEGHIWPRGRYARPIFG
jgi:hypothetical protein